MTAGEGRASDSPDKTDQIGQSIGQAGEGRVEAKLKAYRALVKEAKRDPAYWKGAWEAANELIDDLRAGLWAVEEERDQLHALYMEYVERAQGLEFQREAAQAEARRLRETLEAAEEFLHTLRLATTKEDVWAIVSPHGGWPEQVHSRINAALLD